MGAAKAAKAAIVEVGTAEACAANAMDDAWTKAYAIDDWDVWNGRFDMEQVFPTEEVCRQYVVRKRWPQGFSCPRCYERLSYPVEKRGLMECSRPSCRYQVSITAGTIFHRTRTPLKKWFYAIKWVNDNRLLHPSFLRERLGVSYKTACSMLSKIQDALDYYCRTVASELRHPMEAIFLHPDIEASPDFPKEAVLQYECVEEGEPPRPGKITRDEWEERHEIKKIFFQARRSCFLLNVIACIEAPPLRDIIRERRSRASSAA
ncbi:transposase [Paenibacillus antri]|uniref:Transposase n=1 Tax=Paenibacillus antri TaxID=2582848 RepID=A0A5R9GL82_9BACL|nr:transposase [Paenibacillus antri]TLS54318.1 transposase [Paenibacillus antri]